MINLLNMRKFVIVLIAASLLAIAQHHHDDFDGHEDCPICALIHECEDIKDHTPEVTVFWFILFLITIPHLTQKTFSTILHYRPRGPPNICLA